MHFSSTRVSKLYSMDTRDVILVSEPIRDISMDLFWLKWSKYNPFFAVFYFVLSTSASVSDGVLLECVNMKNDSSSEFR